MKNLILKLIILNLMGISMTFAASNKTVECSNPRLGKKWILSNDKLTVIEDQERHPTRNIASLSQELAGVRTQLTPTGLSKIVYFEGNKYTINIANLHSPSDINDYLAIKSNEGHEIIYPLNCK